MRTLFRTILVTATALVAAGVFAEVDVYGNTIIYESDGVTVKYRFWFGNQTAEAMSGADSVSASASPSADFEPRYLTSAWSDGRCTIPGLQIIFR